MEQKKTLWIIAAAGAFLLVVLGTAGILYSPARTPRASVATVAPVEKTKTPAQTSGWTNYQADVQPPVPATKVSDMIVLADNTTVYNLPGKEEAGNATTIDLNALKNGYIAENQAVAQSEPQSQNINITVNIPEKESNPPAPLAPARETVDISGSEAASVQKSAETKKEPVTAAVASTSTSKAKTSTSSAPAASSKTSSTSVKTGQSNVNVTVNTGSVQKEEPKKTQFWVQVAAYSNKKGAENARSILDSNRIPADIFTYQDSKEKLFYRVRIGPYNTKSEAEYWRSLIVKIDEFTKADSFVTSTTY